MFENIKSMFRMFFKSRLAVGSVVMTLLFFVLIWRVFYLQVVNGEQYQNNYTLKILKERTINSSRGNIYDRNGKLLAYNELAYSVTIEDNGTYASTKEKNRALNAEIVQIITALEENGDKIINDFKIDLSQDGKRYSYNAEGTSLKRFLADVYGANSYADLGYDEKLGYNPAEATPLQVMEYLYNSYGIESKKEDSIEQLRTNYKTAVVRFAMAQNAYQKYIATTIASNISEKSVAYISEHMHELQGVEIIDDTIRKYNNSKYFASILGYTGKISSEEYAKLSETDERYTLNDVVGKGGIEQYMDATLKGEKGYEKLYVDVYGRVIEVIEREESAAGQNVYLSLDSDLQIAVYHLLEQEIAGIVYSNIENPTSDINIPITDVYFALINNNIIRMSSFDAQDATDSERAVKQIFLNREAEVRRILSEDLSGSASKKFKDLGVEEQDYYTYIVRRLKKNGILLEKNIDTSDAVYKQWQQQTISVQEYFTHAISKGWIDITQFRVENKYSDSTEIYEAFCNYILDELMAEEEFSKIVYRYLIQSGAISGRQLCLILFDQKVLPYQEEEVAGLQSGSISPVTFLKEKIKNLDITPAQLALDPCSGSCVVADTRTGELLAMVSYPGYDSNRLANTVDAEYFNSLQNDKSLPQYNYATQQGTAPGSTFKMITATAGFAEGVLTPNEQILTLGEYDKVSNRPKCWIYSSHFGTHGLINNADALRVSCNYFFYEVGYRLSTNNHTSTYNDPEGIEKLGKYAALFGLDETTGIEIEENEPQIANEFPVMAAIGQSNNRYTTVQLSRYVTAVANGGTVYNYTLLNRVEDSDGKILETFEPKIRNTIDILNSAEWSSIHSGMRMVVENTAAFKDFPISAAGKTGTAQEDLSRANHALFVGYAPYENPEISVATRIAYGYSSNNASALSKNVFAYYFKVADEDALLSGQAEEIDSSSNRISD